MTGLIEEFFIVHEWKYDYDDRFEQSTASGGLSISAEGRFESRFPMTCLSFSSNHPSIKFEAGTIFLCIEI